MDIGGSELDGFFDHVMDQPDDRGAVVVHLLVFRKLVLFGFGEIDLGVGKLLEHRVSRFPFRLTVVAVDRLLDMFLRGQSDFDGSIENEAKVGDCVDVERVGNQNPNRVVLFGVRIILFSRATDSGTS